MGYFTPKLHHIQPCWSTFPIISLLALLFDSFSWISKFYKNLECLVTNFNPRSNTMLRLNIFNELLSRNRQTSSSISTEIWTSKISYFQCIRHFCFFIILPSNILFLKSISSTQTRTVCFCIILCDLILKTI